MKFLDKLFRRALKPENPTLVAAIHAAYEQRDDPATRERVNRALLKGNLVLPLGPGSEMGKKFNLIPRYNDRGESTILVFTDVPQMQRWRPEGGEFATIKSVEAYRLVLQSPASAITINISGREPWNVPRALLKILADKMIPKDTVSGTNAMRLEIGEPSEFQVSPLSQAIAPDVMAAVLEGLRQNASLIRAAYAVNLGFNKNAARPAIGILFLDGTRSNQTDETIQNILRLLPVMPEGESLDFWALSPGYLARVQAVAKPFFPSS